MNIKSDEKFEINQPLEFRKKTKYIQKFDKFNFNIEKIKAEFLTIFYEIKEWSKDDPDLYDFNAICVNQKPNDPKSISGGNVRGKYWTYPKSDWNEEERLINIKEEEFTSKRCSTSCAIKTHNRSNSSNNGNITVAKFKSLTIFNIK